MTFALSHKATKIILGVAITGLVISVLVHIEAVFLSGFYHELYGGTLFGIGLVSVLFPVLYETYYSDNSGYDFRDHITQQHFPKWTRPVWSVATLYFFILFGAVINGVLSGKADAYIDRLFWSWGSVIVFLGSSLYLQAVLKVSRS